MRAGVPALGLALMLFAPMRAFCMEPESTRMIPLPSPAEANGLSVERAIGARRSVRDFADRPVSLDAIAQLLWAAQGVTSSDGRRSAPSAGALYPLETYVAAGHVVGLDAAVYRYHPQTHSLVPHRAEDVRADLARAALGQRWMADAPAVLVITAVYERTRRKYGARTERYVHMETGHAAQNIYLQAESLNLGTVMVGAFRDKEVRTVLDLPPREAPLALMPVGHPE